MKQLSYWLQMGSCVICAATITYKAFFTHSDLVFAWLPCILSLLRRMQELEAAKKEIHAHI